MTSSLTSYGIKSCDERSLASLSVSDITPNVSDKCLLNISNGELSESMKQKILILCTCIVV